MAQRLNCPHSNVTTKNRPYTSAYLKCLTCGLAFRIVRGRVVPVDNPSQGAS